MDLFVILVLAFFANTKITNIFIFFFIEKNDNSEKKCYNFIKKKGIWRNGRRYGLEVNIFVLKNLKKLRIF